MRILHVISGIDPGAGGPTAALCGLAEAQARAGLDVTVLATWRRPIELDVAARLRVRGVTVRLVGPARGPFATHSDLAAAAREAVSRADVVHIHALWEDAQHRAAAAARALGVPYVMRPCGMLDPWCLAHHRLRKWVYMRLRLRADLDHAAAIHFTSNQECERCAPLGIRAPVIVEPLGLDFREFDDLPAHGTFRDRWPRLGDRPYVVFLGRLSEKKGLDLLIPAFAAARRRRREMLVIAGPPASPQFQHQLERAVHAHGLADDVLFTGMLLGGERLAALAEADLFVLPSRQENFAVSVAEAMGANCPVLVSDQVNICDDIRDAAAGAVLPLDVGAWAAALSRWLANPGLRRATARRAARFAREHYDWPRIAEGWCDQYDQLLATRRRAARPRPLQLVPQLSL